MGGLRASTIYLLAAMRNTSLLSDEHARPVVRHSGQLYDRGINHNSTVNLASWCKIHGLCAAFERLMTVT